LFRPFGFIAPKTLNDLDFQSFDFEHTWWRLFQRCVVCIEFDIFLPFYRSQAQTNFSIYRRWIINEQVKIWIVNSQNWTINMSLW
jgi:hypothetical protein